MLTVLHNIQCQLMDKRIQKTKQALQQAMLNLIQQKSYEDIQIQDITNEADTARVTFYRHYSTKEELLLDCMDQFYEDMKTILDGIEPKDVLDLRQAVADVALFQFCDERSELCRILLTGPTSWLVQDRLRYYIVERTTMMFAHLPQVADLPVGLITNHVASCVIGNLTWWITRGKPYSVEYIAHITHSMSMAGAMAVVGRLDAVILPDLNSWQQENLTIISGAYKE
jgi:AcrR family transcriptional regulator